MNNPNHRSHTLHAIDFAGALFLIAITFVLYGVAIRPWFHKREGQSQVKSQLANQQKLADQQRSLRDRLERQIVEVRQKLAGSEIKLQTVDKLNQRVADLNQIMVEMNLAVERLEPGQSRHLSNFDALAMRMEGTGSYPHVGLLLRRLRQRFPDMSVASVRLTSNASGDAAMSRYDLTLLWHTRPTHSGPMAAAEK